MLEVNSKAIDFILPDENGISHALSDYRGKKVVLYFYPKDNTPGCTKQACAFKEMYDVFNQNNIVVIGISKDSSASHLKFKNKFELPFILLSDPDTEVIQKYDVWHEKKMCGKTYMGIVRSTYIIDEEGIITHAMFKVNPEKNPIQVKEALGL